MRYLYKYKPTHIRAQVTGFSEAVGVDRICTCIPTVETVAFIIIVISIIFFFLPRKPLRNVPLIPCCVRVLYYVCNHKYKNLSTAGI